MHSFRNERATTFEEVMHCVTHTELHKRAECRHITVLCRCAVYLKQHIAGRQEGTAAYRDCVDHTCLLEKRMPKRIGRLKIVILLAEFLDVNPLECKGNHSATSYNMKLVHWPLMGELLHLVHNEGTGRDGTHPGRSSLYQM